MFSTLGSVRTREALDPVEKLTDWELFQSLASELISSDVQIHSSNKADEVARDFAVSIASACRLSTRKTTILDRKYEILYLEHLLEYKRKFGKLWQETRDPACKTAINWVTRNIRRMVRKKHLKEGKQNWQTAKSHLKQYGLLQNSSEKEAHQRHHL
jgi:hypothetical protein